VAINWNSALAWISSFLADQGDGQPATPGACKVDYTLQAAWPGGFTSQATITNTGSAPINGWSLRWAWTGDQKVSQAYLATVSQSGATVTATNLSFNRQIKPGHSTTFGFIGQTGGGANPTPGLFTLNGKACR
jgi:endoglucanase